jgi:hypothetical protein
VAQFAGDAVILPRICGAEPTLNIFQQPVTYQKMSVISISNGTMKKNDERFDLSASLATSCMISNV